MKEKNKIIMDSLIESKEFKAKREYEGSLRAFCRELWESLNKNIWGKAILLVGAIFVVGNIIIKIVEFGRAVELIFSIPLIILGCYLIIMYAAKISGSRGEKESFEEETKKLNELSQKNPQPLVKWLEDSEQLKSKSGKEDVELLSEIEKEAIELSVDIDKALKEAVEEKVEERRKLLKK